MKVKISNIIISSLLILAAFLGIIFGTILLNYNVPLIMYSATNNYALKIEGKYYNLPVYLHYCEYDYQEDESYIISITYYNNNDYFINSKDFDLSTINNGLDCYVEQDSYYMHGDDALPTGFYIIANKNLRGNYKTTDDVPLNASSISEILEISGVLGVPVTYDNSDLDPFEIVDVLDDQKQPVFNGFEGIMTTNVDNPITIEEIKNYLKVVDEVDGDLTDKIVVENDSYSENSRKIGTYPITFSATDKSGNKASITIHVKVVDITYPTLLGPDSIDSNISNPKSIEEIISEFSASDNYDGNITNQITITKNNYESAEKNKPGSYEIILSAKDSSNNVTYKSVFINLIDDIKPLINGPAEYVKDYNTPLTLSTIMSNLTATDNVDGTISNKIQIVENKYKGNESIIGTYTISFNVTDSSGNVSNTFNVSVKVEDNKEPVFYINSIVISTHTFENLSLEVIEDYLVQSSLINTYEDYSIEITENGYINNERIPGTYKMSIKVKYVNGEEDNINLSVFVNNNKQDFANEIEVDNTLNLSFFRNIWNSIVLFFSNCWNWLLNTIFIPFFALFK